jgi:spore maturation protein CgeB
MKILFFTTYYFSFLKQFYAANPDFKQHSYVQMLQKLLNIYFADTGSAYYYAKESGNEVFLVIANCEPLQKQWAIENNFKYRKRTWESDIALEQIKKFKPDVLFIESTFKFYGEFLAAAEPYCKMIAAWISTPFTNDIKLNNIKLILSSTPAFVSEFRKNGINSEYLLPAFDIRILDFIPERKKDIPFSFVGGWSNVHINRKQAIKFLVNVAPIQLWGYGYKEKQYSKRTVKFYKYFLFSEKEPFLDVFNGEVWGLEMYRILQRSLITFNIHEELLKGYVGNMRMFEASGVGTMILNDVGTNISELFIPGKEIETYRNLDEAAEKVNYYIEHPLSAIEIGRNARKRTIKDYNYTNYLILLLRYFKYYLK